MRLTTTRSTSRNDYNTPTLQLFIRAAGQTQGSVWEHATRIGRPQLDFDNDNEALKICRPPAAAELGPVWNPGHHAIDAG